MEVINEILDFAGNIGWIAAVCLLVGTILIIIEMFTPGFAVPGISGIILLLLGIVFTADSFFQGLLIFLIMLAILTIVLIIVIRSATKSKGLLYKSPIIHKESETSEKGYISTNDMKVFIGKVGNAVSALRPAGTCDFDGVRLDVVTEGDFIDKGSVVKIIKVEGRRIVVSLQK
ncbi:MAG: NfeD family protein [Eubacteriales bacterium]